MTKKEVKKIFLEMWKTTSHYHQNDKIAKVEAWNNYTDSLAKEGLITLKQYESWTNPF